MKIMYSALLNNSIQRSNSKNSSALLAINQYTDNINICTEIHHHIHLTITSQAYLCHHYHLYDGGIG